MQVVALCYIFKSSFTQKKILLNSISRHSEIRAHVVSCFSLPHIPESSNVPQSRFPPLVFPPNLKVFLLSFKIVLVLALLQVFASAFIVYYFTKPDNAGIVLPHSSSLSSNFRINISIWAIAHLPPPPPPLTQQ